ncbi:MAG TPA: ABC transporter permease [Dehalococcoidales bacterium]|nr:ABC transporter permease [Dehalococcoidales bacterium]
MTDLNKLGIVFQYEFLKHIRRARLYIILGITLLLETLVLILVPTLTHKGFPGDVKTMAALLTIGPSLAGIGAVFFAGDAIAGEYEQKTGFLLFTNPIKRITLWVGKYLAGLFSVLLLMIFNYLIIAIALLAIYHKVPWQMYESFGLAAYYAAAVLSTTFFFSAISRGSMGATIMSLVFVWVVSGILESILSFTSNPTWFILSSGARSIATVYGGLQALIGSLGGNSADLGNAANFHIATPGMAAWGMTIYFIAGFLGSIILARRRQLA